MGVSETEGSDLGLNFGKCLRSFVRRKQVDSEDTNKSSSSTHHQLAKALSVPHLIAIGKPLNFSQYPSFMCFLLFTLVVVYFCLYLSVAYNKFEQLID